MKIFQASKGWFIKKQTEPQEPVIQDQLESVSENIFTNEENITDPDEGDNQAEAPLNFLNDIEELLKLEIVPPIPEVESPQFCKITFNPFSTEWIKPDDMSLTSSWREENKAAAKDLIDRYGDALTLFFSGTVESQVMLLAFADAGKIPRVYTINFLNDQTISSQADILVKYYQKHGFKMRIVEVDGNAFWTNTALEYTTTLGIISSNEVLRRWGSTSASGVPVMAGTFPYLQKFGDKWYMGDHEQYFIIDKMVADEGMNVISSFVKNTPAQLSSYISEATKFAEENGAESTFDVRSFVQAAYPEYEIISRELSNDEKEFEKAARQIQPHRISICWHEVHTQ
jgi:hypothetical protein